MYGACGIFIRRSTNLVEFSSIHEVHDSRHAGLGLDKIWEIQKKYLIIQHKRVCSKSY
jgi:hypothetical protein